jgi:hypothetical protein
MEAFVILNKYEYSQAVSEGLTVNFIGNFIEETPEGSEVLLWNDNKATLKIRGVDYDLNNSWTWLKVGNVLQIEKFKSELYLF